MTEKIIEIPKKIKKIKATLLNEIFGPVLELLKDNWLSYSSNSNNFLLFFFFMYFFLNKFIYN